MEVDLAKDLSEEKSEFDELKNSFVSLVSHEMRTPISIMGGFLEISLDLMAEGKNKEAIDYLTKVQSNLGRLTRIVEELTDFSKVNGRNIHVTEYRLSFPKALQEVVDLFSPFIESKNLELIWSLPDRLNEVGYDAEGLIVIIRNLLSNSVKFSPDNTKIKILSPKSQNVSTFVVAFVDKSPLIPKRKWEKLFSDFDQLENHLTRRYEGMGLGLAVAKRYAIFLGGNLEYMQKENKNVFLLTLPRKLKNSARNA